MTSPAPERIVDKEFWRKRLNDAKLRLDLARNYVNEVRSDLSLRLLLPPDGKLALHAAIQAEKLSLQKYARVLEHYEKLTMTGIPPSGAESAEGRTRLTKVLHSAITTTRADIGNIQILDSSANSLRILVQLGFDSRFLGFFNHVHAGQAACGAALASGSQIVVEDVTTSPIFAGTDSLDAMLDARARAVQSTPLIGTSGRLLGMLSTHYHRTVRPSEDDLQILKLYGERAALVIESAMP